MIAYDRAIFFDMVRKSPFPGTLAQSQVNGMEAVLRGWERYYPDGDPRWLAYCFATDFHETAQTMLPVEEYGKGAGQPYGVPDHETGQTYYGRGLVQLTWRDNYARADRELGLSGSASCEWHADNALDPLIAGRVMAKGMEQGWFRSDDKGPQNLPRYFHDDVADPKGARQIINGDQNVKPSWGGGQTMPEIIADYYDDFLAALHASVREGLGPSGPEAPPLQPLIHATVYLTISAPADIEVIVKRETPEAV